MRRRWERWAACAREDSAIFFPVLNGRGSRGVKADPNAVVWARARAVCAVCPVVTSCLEAVLEAEAAEPCEAEGYRAGLTPGEREVMRRATRAARRAAAAQARVPAAVGAAGGER